ncbi:MAG: PAS domain S-box protein [Anaerolineae bacterium]|nr:PAS domain S-box protein [Anaerolineae bacterium]
MIQHILVVEDDATHAELIHRAFADDSEKFTVEIVNTLTDARQRIESGTPELALVDIVLPDGKGIDLLTEQEDEVAFPIVVMTSHGDEQMAVDAMKGGALDYIVKTPATLIDLPHIAARALREWQHIVARRHAEAQFRRSNAELRAFVETAAQGVVAMDRAGTILLVNHQLEIQFGYHRDDLIDKPFALLAPKAAQAIQHMSPSTEVDTYAPGKEYVGLRQDGSKFPIEVAISFSETEGNTRVLALITDITERKRQEEEALAFQRMQLELERERELNQHKNHFLSMISHEFRTPLAIILSSSDILRKYGERLSPDGREDHFSKITRGVRRLEEMINDILLLSRVDMRRIECNPQWHNLMHFCSNLVDEVSRATQTERIELKPETERDTAYFDALLLEHILVNLLTNAVKYSPDEGIVVLSIANNEHECIFVVSDQGIGIPDEDQSRIFEPFHRASNSEMMNGTGLGLAIVKEFTYLHNGTVSVQSRLGQGTSFTVTIPQPGSDDA